MKLLWFATSFEIQIDGGNSFTVDIFSHGFVFAFVGRVDFGYFQRNHIVQLGVLNDTHFETTAFLHCRSFMEPNNKTKTLNPSNSRQLSLITKAIFFFEIFFVFFEKNLILTDFDLKKRIVLLNNLKN